MASPKERGGTESTRPVVITIIPQPTSRKYLICGLFCFGLFEEMSIYTKSLHFKSSISAFVFLVSLNINSTE